jgi:hypothetical protein
MRNAGSTSLTTYQRYELLNSSDLVIGWGLGSIIENLSGNHLKRLDWQNESAQAILLQEKK